MAPSLRKPHQLVVIKDGRDKDHVWRMRHTSARTVAVVVPVEIARPYGLGRILRENGVEEVAAQWQVGPEEHTPVMREECCKVVFLLANERRHRRTLDKRFHFGTRRTHHALNQL